MVWQAFDGNVFEIFLSRLLLLGDVSNDQELGVDDVAAFVESLAAQNEVTVFLNYFSGGNFSAPDTAFDGLVDNVDLGGFIQTMREPGIGIGELGTSPIIPEPATVILLAMAFLYRHGRSPC